MAPLVGTYQFESQNNFVEYLQSLGLSAEHAKHSENTSDQLVVGPIKGDKVTVAFNGNGVVFTLNKEVSYELFPGLKKKATATLTGNKLTVKTKIADDGSFTEEKVFESTDSGLVINVTTSKGMKAVRRYKRL